MATGSGKTFTAVNVYLPADQVRQGAAGSCSWWTATTSGRQTLSEFQQYVTPRQRAQVHRGVQRPAPPVEHARPGQPGRASPPSSGSTRCSAARPSSTRRTRRGRCSSWTAAPIRSRCRSCYNPSDPDRDLRRHRRRRVPPLDLQPVAAGARILRRLPDRPDRHADQADLGFFNQNLVKEYSREQAVADGVNVGCDVYRIRTQITERRHARSSRALCVRGATGRPARSAGRSWTTT